MSEDSYLSEFLNELSLEMWHVSEALGYEHDGGSIKESIQNLADNAKRIANAITDGGAAPGRDAAGGCIASLTESVMGVTMRPEAASLL